MSRIPPIAISTAQWISDASLRRQSETDADSSTANAGMGVCLTMANEQDAYILSDKATFLTFRANGGILE